MTTGIRRGMKTQADSLLSVNSGHAMNETKERNTDNH